MTVAEHCPYKIRHIEHCWIPMTDGIRLSARIWMPEDAETKPVPAIFEYIPYRKRDGVRLRDETMHPYFAGHGYACIRVDIRGSGDSQGVLTDEYLQQETAVVQWKYRHVWYLLGGIQRPADCSDATATA
jgi:predicted acyl esterase